MATWAPALLLLVLALCSQLAAAADIISSSKLESCIAEGSQVGLAAAMAAAAVLELRPATSPTALLAFLQQKSLQIMLELSDTPRAALMQHIRTQYADTRSFQQDCCTTDCSTTLSAAGATDECWSHPAFHQRLCWTLCLQPLPQGSNASYIACNQKLIVVLTVDSGDTIATQDLTFQLSCVGR